MRSIYIVSFILVCVAARIPFMNYAVQDDNIKEGSNDYFDGSIEYGVFYPFQRIVIINQTQYVYGAKVTYNETYVNITAQFLEDNGDGEMVPRFIIPVNNTVMTVRLHNLPCYPEQGGYYYRNDEQKGFGDDANEVVGTRATDDNGNLNMTIYRPWAVRTNSSQSIVITSATDGLILCTNLDWKLVDGAFSSAVSMVSLLAVIGMIMKQIFFE